MPEELRRRRAGFCQGPVIRLADGQTWVFPAPAEDAARSEEIFGPGYTALVRSVFEAEDRPEQLRCELALAIRLLSHNYELAPAEYRALLGFQPDSPELAQAQAEFHALALDHAGRLLGPVQDAAPVAAQPSGWRLFRSLSRLWSGGQRRPARWWRPAAP
jgi:hypothetical protein